jgi:hypothetical protein
MKKKLFSLSIAVCLTAVMSLNAQVSFGPKAGLNLATLSGDAGDVDMKIGLQIGGMVDMKFSDALSLQPGLILSMKGAQQSASAMGINMKSTYSYNYLEVPINLVFGLDMGDNQFQIFAGPYIAYGLFGKTSFSVGDEKDETDVQFVSDYMDADDDKDAAAPIDFGANFGVGFKAGAIQIQAGYGLGFGNVIPKYDGEAPEDVVTNSVIQLNFAYLLGN